jgi:hypothetical protein
MISGFSTSAKLTLISAIFSSADMFAPGWTNDASCAFRNLSFASLSCVCASSILFSITAISSWIATGSAMVGYGGAAVVPIDENGGW